jgi:hypothetical protein
MRGDGQLIPIPGLTANRGLAAVEQVFNRFRRLTGNRLFPSGGQTVQQLLGRVPLREVAFALQHLF